ncbi:TetR/AcrR family transcriptional regulator [Actinomadura violacea]|uniref:TetR/AcrR family transcriptional regulator n=1 Tax=Actinomadura violacea TaxID=2819934 RepID=A0ABS3S032_9ACTN|nr:TetR/AcrR family transcriptional regulator [Actinomadura violacea]MBO2462357.1 TetR/AcrR family transcriptional regulator [Actinomadura violacea]
MTVKSDARMRILIAAERLFAERGITDVSLREIGAAAGQRNNSAVQYHFGDKEGLLKALYEHRLAPLNRRRLELLDEIETEDPRDELLRLVRAYVHPLIEQARHGRSHYARFVSRYVAAGHLPAEPFGREHLSGVTQIMGRIEAHMGDLPSPLRHERLRMMQLLVTSVAADLERRVEQHQITPDHAGLVARELVETTAGLVGQSAGTER